MTKPETIEYKNHLIEIWPDEDVHESPNDWYDGENILVHNHRDCDIQGKLAQECFEQQEESPYWNTHWWFPTKAYIHSGTVLSIDKGGFAQDPGSWDTSRCGYFLISKQQFPKETDAYIEAKSFCEKWNQYLSGEIYGYEIPELNEGCWGYYGEDGKNLAIAHAKKTIDTVITESKEPNIPVTS